MNNEADVIITKYCKECNQNLPRTRFHKNGRCVHPICGECRSKVRASKRYNRKDGTKYCHGCNKDKKVLEYHSDRSQPDGLQGHCKLCKNITRLKYLSTYDGFLINLFKDLKYNAKRRKIQVDVTLEDIKELYISQNKKCIYTGIVLTHEICARNTQQHIINKWNISVDRIDSTNYYDKNNIQISAAIINRMKCTLTHENFILLCKRIALNGINDVSLKYFNNKIELTMNNIITNTPQQKWSCNCKNYIKKIYLGCRSSLKHRAKKLDFDICEDYILQLYNTQEGKCNISGINMTYIAYQNTKNDYNISIDRVDSTKGYIVGNIQLVCLAINRMKADLPQNEFLDIIEMVYTHNKDNAEAILNKL